ncbi:GNAT family N-acetyltransferase [Thermomonospora umbrina]|uniref:RimJ/RimL family protein N-acetyltransferase n=1 Tax=Thermomonospora umbrina TaxID=111806 RepID=A0A3D9SY51_9ACTN|nr:GNAT family protein [Thermomonospora umbrina]REE96541.1 RimJ/RimL family protein N-acetyltransferase [Thermomonospora umbrina]
MYPVRIVGVRTVLRELRSDDVEALASILGDDSVTRPLAIGTQTRKESEALVARALERATLVPRSDYHLAVTGRDEDTVIGYASIRLKESWSAKFTFVLSADRHGNGLATDAGAALIDFAFGDLGLHRLAATLSPDNAAAIALVTKLGGTYEGRVRHHRYTRGTWRDSLLFSLLAHEWTGHPAAQGGRRPSA